MTVCTDGTKETDGTKDNGAHSPACGIATKVTRDPLETNGTTLRLQYCSYLHANAKGLHHNKGSTLVGFTSDVGILFDLPRATATFGPISTSNHW